MSYSMSTLPRPFTLPAWKILTRSVRYSLRMVSCLQLVGSYHLPSPLGFLIAPVFASLSYIFISELKMCI